VLWQLVIPPWPHRKTKCVSEADAVPQSNNINPLGLHNSQVEEFAHVGNGMGTDFPEVKFATPAF
jgi:hypothetical protein